MTSEEARALLPPSVWRRRWAVLKYTLFIAGVKNAAIVGWAVWTSKENAMLTQISLALIALAGGLVTAYIFGANKDDANLRESLVKLAPATNPGAS